MQTIESGWRDSAVPGTAPPVLEKPAPALERLAPAGESARSAVAPVIAPRREWEEVREAISLAATQLLLEEAASHAGARARHAPCDPLVQMMIADALLDAGVDPHHPVLQSTIEAILRHRLDAAASPRPIELDGRCGDLAAMAQALLLFARLGRHDLIATHCAPPLAVLLAYAEADGVLPTWILPDTMAEGAETIASLIYALARWDARRFLGMIVAGARWVAACQQPDGGWASSAGLDPYHGTWQALRLLGAVMPNHPAVARAVRFLHDRRGIGGGWGAGGSDPRATALALLALRATRSVLADDLPGAALNILAADMEGRPTQPLPQPAHGDESFAATIDHDSRSVTALFVLKAVHALPIA